MIVRGVADRGVFKFGAILISGFAEPTPLFRFHATAAYLHPVGKKRHFGN